MKRADIEIQALAALQKAAEVDCPADKTEWLKVAKIWYEIQDGFKEMGDTPPAPDPNGFMTSYPKISGEIVRLVIRVQEDGKAQVICDPKGVQPTGANVDSAGEAAELAMQLLDDALE